jgi:endonuclease/exonuclease/phosphatase family metal-dependent hydrolase
MLSAKSRRSFLKTIGVAAALPLAARTLLAKSDSKNPATTHRILTCNILLDLREQKGTPEDWSAGRRDVCLSVIKARKPNILCLQEVGRGQYDDFAQAFPGMIAIGYVDPYTDKHPRRFQSAKNVILYSTDRYQQISAGQYWLSETPLIAGSRLKGEGLPRHVTWVRLKDRASQKEFRVICTHWTLTQPSRLIESRMLTTEAGSPYPPEFPQLLAGDLNSESDSLEHKLLIEAGWKDSYEMPHKDFANAVPKPRKIDFIYLHGQVTPIASEMFREQKNGIYPSDHPFVSAEINL